MRRLWISPFESGAAPGLFGVAVAAGDAGGELFVVEAELFVVGAELFVVEAELFVVEAGAFDACFAVARAPPPASAARVASAARPFASASVGEPSRAASAKAMAATGSVRRGDTTLGAYTMRTAGATCRAPRGPDTSVPVQPPIANILHQETIRRLSGDGAFERGRAYFLEGRVIDVQRKDASIVAKVRGATEPYDVRLWMKDESLAYACTCPQGQEQAFCKHAVAVALSFVGGLPRDVGAGRSELPSPPPPATRSEPPAAEARAKPLALSSRAPESAAPRASLADALRALSHEEIVVLVLEAALDDEAFRERLGARLRR